MTRLTAAVVCVLVLGGCPEDGGGGSGGDAGSTVWAGAGGSGGAGGAPVEALYPVQQACADLADCRLMDSARPEFVADYVADCIADLSTTWDQAVANACKSSTGNGCMAVECVLEAR